MKRQNIFIIFVLIAGIVGGTLKSYATFENPLTSISFETPVHFLSPDGSPLVTDSPTFSVEAAEGWIRLNPGNPQDALLIEARQGSHELEISDALALSVPDIEDPQHDRHHLLLLLPDGKSLEATGTYSGIQPRGLFDKVVKKIKKQANQVYKNARSKAKKTSSKARTAARNVKRQIEQGARVSVLKITMETMKQSIEETNRDKRHFLEKLKKVNKKKHEILQTLKHAKLTTQAKDRLKQELKNLEGANKKLNVGLQKAATRFNQAQQALSNVQKKYNDASQAIINNM